MGRRKRETETEKQTEGEGRGRKGQREADKNRDRGTLLSDPCFYRCIPRRFNIALPAAVSVNNSVQFFLFASADLSASLSACLRTVCLPA